MTDNSFDTIQGEISSQLEAAGIAYLKIGLATFHQSKSASWVSYQPAVGNLCIAVELLLKTLIARKAFRYLFTDLPLEAQIYLSHPETVPDATAFRRYAIDLKGFKYKAPELDTCISVFYTIHPDAKPDFRPYLSLLSRVRNRSVHTALQAFEKYDLYRVAHVSLKLLQFLEEAGLVDKWAYLLTSDDKQFLAEYDAERVERVGKAIDDLPPFSWTRG